MARRKRFVWDNVQNGLLKKTSLIIDTETGVNYLFVQEGYAGGLTPLLDKDGKPVITSYCGSMVSEILNDKWQPCEQTIGGTWW